MGRVLWTGATQGILSLQVVRMEKNRLAQSALPDVILLDIQMPGMTGMKQAFSDSKTQVLRSARRFASTTKSPTRPHVVTVSVYVA